LSVPVVVAGRPWARLGVLDTESRPYTQTDVDVVQSIAHALAAAVERDEIEAARMRLTEDLQRALLPTRLPAVPGLATAARYSPAGGGHVGGDWYDILELPHGTVGLAVGDVEGHDSLAAAVMGQVRTVLRLYVGEGHTPAEVMARVNRFVAEQTDRLVTCMYSELNPSQHSLISVSAGHRPPLVLDAVGRRHRLRVVPGLPLGFDPDTRYGETTTILPASATILMVTDGLVDDMPGAIHPSWPRFVALARSLTDVTVDALADRLIDRPDAARGQRDDAALLVVRLGAGTARPGVSLSDDEEPARRVLKPDPESAPAARRFVRDILTQWRLPELVDSATLAVSELVTNTITHTTSAVELTLRRTGPTRVWIGVFDDSDRAIHRQDPASDQISGRGLAIVEAIADCWGITPATRRTGKTVWLELTDAYPGRRPERGLEEDDRPLRPTPKPGVRARGATCG